MSEFENQVLPAQYEAAGIKTGALGSRIRFGFSNDRAARRGVVGTGVRRGWIPVWTLPLSSWLSTVHGTPTWQVPLFPCRAPWQLRKWGAWESRVWKQLIEHRSQEI